MPRILLQGCCRNASAATYTVKTAGYHSRPAVMAALATIAGIAGQCDGLPRIAPKVVATMTKEGPTWPVSLTRWLLRVPIWRLFKWRPLGGSVSHVAANKTMTADLADVLYLFSLVARALSRPHLVLNNRFQIEHCYKVVPVYPYGATTNIDRFPASRHSHGLNCCVRWRDTGFDWGVESVGGTRKEFIRVCVKWRDADRVLPYHTSDGGIPKGFVRITCPMAGRERGLSGSRVWWWDTAGFARIAFPLEGHWGSGPDNVFNGGTRFLFPFWRCGKRLPSLSNFNPR